MWVLSTRFEKANMKKIAHTDTLRHRNSPWSSWRMQSQEWVIATLPPNSESTRIRFSSWLRLKYEEKRRFEWKARMNRGIFFQKSKKKSPLTQKRESLHEVADEFVGVGVVDGDPHKVRVLDEFRLGAVGADVQHVRDSLFLRKTQSPMNYTQTSMTGSGSRTETCHYQMTLTNED